VENIRSAPATGFVFGNWISNRGMARSPLEQRPIVVASDADPCVRAALRLDFPEIKVRGSAVPRGIECGGTRHARVGIRNVNEGRFEGMEILRASGFLGRTVHCSESFRPKIGFG